MNAEIVVGIFVGGSGNRMGGVAKGLLKAPDADMTLLERLLAELRSALPAAQIVLVGKADAYVSLGLTALNDDPPGVGPLGGLLGLLEYAQKCGAPSVLALACDLPRLGAGILARLASESRPAAALVTAVDGVRNPLLARYTVTQAMPAARDVLQAGNRSLQAVLDRLTVTTLSLSAAEASTLGDWDSPEDMT